MRREFSTPLGVAVVRPGALRSARRLRRRPPRALLYIGTREVDGVAAELWIDVDAWNAGRRLVIYARPLGGDAWYRLTEEHLILGGGERGARAP